MLLGLTDKVAIVTGASRGIVAEANIIRMGEPDDITGVVTYVASSRARYLHGAMIDMDGGQTKTL